MFTNRTQVEPCIGMTGECNIYISSTNISINVIAIIINIIHIIILKTIPGLSKRNQFPILVSITLADILVAITLALNTSCMIHDIQLSANNIVGSAFLLVGKESTTQSRYLLLLLASLDRFYAVCKPFKYGTSTVVNNLGKASLAVFIVSVVIPVVKFLAILESLCLSNETGPVLFNGSTKIKALLSIISLSLMLLPAVATAILLGNVGWQLKKMKKRARFIGEELKTASKYIIGTCIMFYSIIIPHFFFKIMATAFKQWASHVKPVASAFWICQSLYGIGNVIFYAYLHPSYVERCKSIVRCQYNAVEDISCGSKPRSSN